MRADIVAYLQEKYTAGQLDKWIGLLVQSAPSAIYGLIKAVYGNQFPFNYAPRYEMIASSKIAMSDFLLRKMREKATQAEREAFVKQVYDGVPAAAINVDFALDYIKTNY